MIKWPGLWKYWCSDQNSSSCWAVYCSYECLLSACSTPAGDFVNDVNMEDFAVLQWFLNMRKIPNTLTIPKVFFCNLVRRISRETFHYAWNLLSEAGNSKLFYRMHTVALALLSCSTLEFSTITAINVNDIIVLGEYNMSPDCVG